MLLSDLKHDFVRTYPTPLAAFDLARFAGLCAAMAREARETLDSERVPAGRQHLQFSLDLRYVGQYHEVSLPLTPDDIQALDLDSVSARFHARHDQLYGYAVPNAPLELVTVRLTASGETDKPRLPRSVRQPADSSRALKGRRRAYLPSARDFAELPVFDGDALTFGNQVHGPALIEQVTTTTFVPAEYDVVCDALGSFVMTLKGRPGAYE
jgi:N-methylhydantoinase A